MEELMSGDPPTVGPFTLRGRLGAGGMGQVYLGQAPDGRLAAVKVVHGGFADDRRFRDRFAREIETAAKVRAPWTAAVIDANPNAERPWLATEYVTGPSLDDAVGTSGPLNEAALLLLASRLATALAELHAFGVVHRDLKPSNVLLAEDGPMLIDFGIARALDATRMTSTGVIFGTPSFMSPEQALGTGDGTASDVFSLAGVLVFAAIGRGPFGSAATPVVMIKRIVAEPPELSGVPERLRGELERCLAKEPQDRPTAAELADRLAAIARDVPGAAWPSPAVAAMVNRTRFDIGSLVSSPRWTPSPAPPRSSGRPRWLIVGLVAVLVLVSGGAVAAVAVSQLQAGQNVIAGPASPSPTPVVPPSPAPAGPPREVSVSLIPSQIPGWTASLSESRNAAYDVPEGWTVSGPGLIAGWKHLTSGQDVVFRGVAQRGSVGCPDGQTVSDRWAGIAGSDLPDPAVAARDAAQLWGESAYSFNDALPQVTVGDARPVTVNGRQGSHVTATVAKPQGYCGLPNAVVHVVALPADPGQNVLWVLLTDAGVTPDTEIEQMITTIRPAGRQAACPPDRAVGTWC